MIKLKAFSYEEADKASKFIEEHGINRKDIHLGKSTLVLMYDDAVGMEKADVLNQLKAELKTAQSNRIAQEFQRRFWLGKTLEKSLSGKAEQEANVELTKAKLDIENCDRDIRTLKNMIEEVQADKFTV